MRVKADIGPVAPASVRSAPGSSPSAVEADNCANGPTHPTASTAMSTLCSPSTLPSPCHASLHEPRSPPRLATRRPSRALLSRAVSAAPRPALRSPLPVCYAPSSLQANLADLTRLQRQLRQRAVTAGHLRSAMDPRRAEAVSVREFQRGVAMIGVRPLLDEVDVKRLFALCGVGEVRSGVEGRADASVAGREGATDSGASSSL